MTSQWFLQQVPPPEGVVALVAWNDFGSSCWSARASPWVPTALPWALGAGAQPASPSRTFIIKAKNVVLYLLNAQILRTRLLLVHLFSSLHLPSWGEEVCNALLLSKGLSTASSAGSQVAGKGAGPTCQALIPSRSHSLLESSLKTDPWLCRITEGVEGTNLSKISNSGHIFN